MEGDTAESVLRWSGTQARGLQCPGSCVRGIYGWFTASEHTEPPVLILENLPPTGSPAERLARARRLLPPPRLISR